jgi:predicted nucleic acid-binding protein
MKVLVDTSVWSLALRRKEPSEIATKLTDLILSSLVVMIGPVRQEILSGISDTNAFLKLKAKLEAFDDFDISTKDYEMAAEFYNICRKNGIQGSHTDFLICAVAHNNNFLIYTTDKDFDNFAKYLPIKRLNQD